MTAWSWSHFFPPLPEEIRTTGSDLTVVLAHFEPMISLLSVTACDKVDVEHMGLVSFLPPFIRGDMGPLVLT